MLKYVELCVDLRKGKMVKEGLHQYKNIAQNTSVNTIEVINRAVHLRIGRFDTNCVDLACHQPFLRTCRSKGYRSSS